MSAVSQDIQHPHTSLWRYKDTEVAGESCEWAAEKEQGEETGEKGWGTGEVPWLGQEFRDGVLSPAWLGTQSSSGLARIKLYRPLLTLNSVSLYLPLIGFNERFNNTALPDQIKLLLSIALNPGSLLCNASMSRDPPFCKILATSLLALASHILSLLSAQPPVCFS